MTKTESINSILYCSPSCPHLEGERESVNKRCSLLNQELGFYDWHLAICEPDEDKIMDVHHPDPCEELKKARYRFMKKYELYEGKATVGYTDRSLVVFVYKDLGFDLPDEFEGHPVRVTKV